MIPALLATILPIASRVLEKIIPDAAERERVKMELELRIKEQEDELLKAAIQSDIVQAEINKIEAASPDKFKSWPRPAAMWISVIGLAWTVFPVIVGQFFVWFGYSAPVVVPLPSFVVNTLLYGLLGLGAYRTYEKQAGVSK